ncbi:hypothetical protein [Algoriphagus persicinus]|uniref:hypothetical protein n=1 Tax=Algoriphagus persicinus TaxID=3108754 RepID=UPI002B37ED11|nr:hypothetical protein [Algoriphagus sp. E1-3-M2]MEB2783233.1 hypothetical protein [Algoriphagus sp. E1-3-M2]
MRYLIVLICVFSLISCQSQKDQIKGEWTVDGLSEFPLSISNYGDLMFDKSSRALFDGEQLKLFSNDSFKEKVDYKIEDGKLILIYADYGIPFEIEYLTEGKLILIGGGCGNTQKERERYFKLELKR